MKKDPKWKSIDNAYYGRLQAMRLVQRSESPVQYWAFSQGCGKNTLIDVKDSLIAVFEDNNMTVAVEKETMWDQFPESTPPTRVWRAKYQFRCTQDCAREQEILSAYRSTTCHLNMGYYPTRLTKILSGRTKPGCRHTLWMNLPRFDIGHFNIWEMYGGWQQDLILMDRLGLLNLRYVADSVEGAIYSHISEAHRNLYDRLLAIEQEKVHAKTHLRTTLSQHATKSVFY